MREVINFIKQKTLLLGAVVLAAVVGGMTTAVVMAAIPDSQGVIHGCIRPTNDNLRIIDTEAGQTCTGGQTPISWDQEGVKAYGRILGDGTIDTTRSKNIVSVTRLNDGTAIGSTGTGGPKYCIDLAVAVKSVNATLEIITIPEGWPIGPVALVSVGSTAWNDMEGPECPAGTNALVIIGNENASFNVTFF